MIAGKLLPREDDAFTKASLEAIVQASGDVAILKEKCRLRRLCWRRRLID